MMDADDPIIGGETPFLPFSESYRAFDGEHRPMRMELEGRDATRAMNFMLCAMMWCMEAREPSASKGMELREFMRQFIAGANHDLRALGIEPLISIAEVEAFAKNPEVVKEVAEGEKRRGERGQ